MLLQKWERGVLCGVTDINDGLMVRALDSRSTDQGHCVVLLGNSLPPSALLLPDVLMKIHVIAAAPR